MTRDFDMEGPKEIANDILERVTPGGIIVLHDGDGDTAEDREHESRQPSVLATGMIIESLLEQGYEFLTVTELLARGSR